MNREFWSKIRSMFAGRTRAEEELREELETHLQLEIEDSVSRGLPPDEARRRFGNATSIQEAAVEAWRFPVIEALLQDLRHGLRLLHRSPGFTAVAVLSLAIGIGANTAIFSVTDALLLRPLPVKNPRELVLFRHVEPTGTVYNFSYRWFKRLQDQPGVFTDVAASWMIDRYNIRTNGAAGAGDQERVSVALASGNYFRMLGVLAAMGRLLSDDDDRSPGGHPVAVISHRFWEGRFGLAPDVIGRTIILYDTAYTILGVTPRGFEGEWGRPADLWVPYMMASKVMPELPGGPAQFPAVILARLQGGVAIRQAQAASHAVFQQLIREEAGPQRFPAASRLELESGTNGYSERRQTFTFPLAVIMSVVGLVLLVACANLATLSLARAAARQRELAVRLAIGATQGRLLRQLLAEAALLAALGAGVGLAIAIWMARVLVILLAQGTINASRIYVEIHPDARVLGFTAVISLITFFALGMAPAFRSNVSLAPSLGGRGASPGGRFALGKALVAGQVALCAVLLFGAGLFLRTLQNLRGQDLGFATDNALLVWTAPVQTGRTGPALWNLLESVRNRLAGLPGIKAVSLSNGGVLEGGEDRGGRSEQMLFEGYEAKAGMTLRYFAVGPDFFTATGLQLVAGRDFSSTDSDTSPPVAIINRTMARFFYGNDNPIGKRFGGRNGKEMEIVGVARDAKAGSARDSRGVWYVPYRQNARALRLPAWCFIVRTVANSDGFTPRIREEIRKIDDSLPVLRINTMSEQLADVLVPDRLLAAVSAIFGSVAMLVACAGIYGSVSYSTTRRTAEMGVRVALGATQSGILRMVVVESLAVVSTGLAFGLPIAVMLARIVASRLFGVSPVDVPTMVVASALILAVGAFAALLPALRASRVDAMTALRCE